MKSVVCVNNSCIVPPFGYLLMSGIPNDVRITHASCGVSYTVLP